jgi:hypothetical protein
MLTLPPALATLSKLTSKPNSNHRYPTADGVCVTTTTDGWEVAATDFKRMILVSGPHPDPKPEYTALADAPNGATAASVPAKWWADTFNGAKKVRGTPGVGLVLSDRVATASCGTTATRTEVIPGKLAPFADILPKRESDIGYVLRFDPDLMAGLLKALADLTDPGVDPVVTMEIRRPNGPDASDKAVVIRADYPAAGLTAATGLLMPCAAKGDDNGQGTRFYAPAAESDKEQPAPADPGTVERLEQAERTCRDAVAESERLRAELAATRAERDRLRADLQTLRSRPAIAPAVVTHHSPTTPTVRRTLGQLAAARKGGA